MEDFSIVKKLSFNKQFHVRMLPKSKLKGLTHEELSLHLSTVKACLKSVRTPMKIFEEATENLQQVFTELVDKKHEIERLLVPVKVVTLRKVTPKTASIDPLENLSDKEIQDYIKEYMEEKKDGT